MGWFDTDIENVYYSDETLDLAFNFWFGSYAELENA